MSGVYKLITIGAIILCLISVSCSVFDGMESTENRIESSLESYGDILVSTSNFPLYADLGTLVTRSSGLDEESQTVTLESLLDRSKIVTKTFKQYRLNEIPFKVNNDPDMAMLSRNMLATDGHSTEIYLFLIETTDTVLNVVDRKVVTMIPDSVYRSKNERNPYSFINKKVFSGVVLYSNLDGSFRDVYVYGVIFARLLMLRL